MNVFKPMLALCMLASISKAQPYTAETTYGHGAAILTSGTYVNSVPGFIMGGYIPNTTTSGPNFIIDKVFDNGLFTGAASFSREFRMFDTGNSCTGTPVKELNCYGVSVIENPAASSSTIRYAATSAFDLGVVFAALGGNGGIISSSFHTFPNGASAISKPLIAASNSSTGGYYICGSYQFTGTEYVYVIRVAAGGTSIWSSTYDLGNTNFTPKGIVEDNYNSYELAIAGIVGSPSDGFLMTVDESSGTVNLFQGYTSTATSNEEFHSIGLSRAAIGYIVGGSTNVNPSTGQAWMLLLDSFGNISWTSRIQPTNDNTAGNVVGVIERYSAGYTAYEYYGTTVTNASTGGMMVLKLDQNGSAFTSNSTNEFVYNQGSGAVAVSSAISFLDGGATNNNTGIHVFGNNSATAPSRFFLVQACFNGVTGNCGSSQQNLTTMNSVTAGPQGIYGLTANGGNGPQQCSNYILSTVTISPVPNQPCSATTTPTSPILGNNTRSISTSISGADNNHAAFSIFPNPSRGKTEISYVNSQEGSVQIELSNLLGQNIKTLYNAYTAAGDQALSIDLSSMNIQTGVYFVTISTKGKTSQQKIVYSKD